MSIRNSTRILLSSHEIVGEVHPREKGATKDCAGMPCRPYIRALGNKEDSGTSGGAFCLHGRELFKMFNKL